MSDKNTWELTAPCHFGLESVLKREVSRLGCELTRVEDGRVSFCGDALAVCRANIFLRTAERVLLNVASFRACSFDELFEATKSIPWEDYIPRDGRVWVKKASSKASKLFSPSDIQSIVKKAIVERLKNAWHTGVIPETGDDYPLRVWINKDQVSIGLDTSGDSLHRRGYRKIVSKAPITETLAAALILLTPWNKNRILIDPFCGSGTFPIEAALIAANIAPGMNRGFTAENWIGLIPPGCWADARAEARDGIMVPSGTDIEGYDIDADMINAAAQNAKLAGVDTMIHFEQRPVSELDSGDAYGFIITNPPYGERTEEKEKLPEIYAQLGAAFARLDSWSAFIITSYDEVERYMGRKPDKNRKIYNGMMKTYFYEFYGPKPPKQEKR